MTRDNNDIKLYRLFRPIGKVILKKGISQRNTASLLGIFFTDLIIIMSNPVTDAIMLILNNQ